MRAGSIFVLAAACVGAHVPSSAAEIPGASLVLEVTEEPRAGRLPEAAPPRFVLMESGEVFLGGSSRIVSTRLAKADIGALEKKVNLVRKMTGLRSPLTLGPGSQQRRLVVAQGKRLEIVATGDPAAAPAALRPLTGLFATLEEFGAPGLRPYRPSSFRLTARESPVAGGCWPWSFSAAPEVVLAAPVVVPSAEFWPTGVISGSACAGGKTYQVNLRPLLPGER